MTDLTREEIKQAAKEGASEAAREHAVMMLEQFADLSGIDLTTVERRAEWRKNVEWLQASRIGISLAEAEKDHVFWRKIRLQLEKAVWRVGWAVVMAAVAGLLYLAGLGEKIRFPH